MEQLNSNFSKWTTQNDSTDLEPASESGFAAYDEQTIRTVTLALYGLICIVSVSSNLGVIVIILTHRQLRTGSNVLILGLAVADILYSTTGMMFTPISLLDDRWVSGVILCIFIQMLAGMCVHAIAYTTMLIAVDRIRTIASRNALDVRKAMMVTLAIWVFVALLSSPMALKTSVSNNRCVELWDEHEANLRYVYSLVYLFAPFVIPAIVIAVCYARVTKFFEYRYRFARARAQTGAQRQIMRHLKKKRRMSMLSLSIIISFIIFFTPLNVFNLVAEFGHEIVQNSPNSFPIFIASHMLTCASTIANPILYCCFNANFRRVCRTQSVCARMFLNKNRSQTHVQTQIHTQRVPRVNPYNIPYVHGNQLQTSASFHL